ncbi:PDDEXK family nuclease [Viscerimonas tarda]
MARIDSKVLFITTSPRTPFRMIPEIELLHTHFYMLHKTNIRYYGGTSIIVPLPLNIFQKMVDDSYKASYIPNPQHVKRFFERSNEIANACDNEKMWYEEITNEALNWLG